MRMTQRVILELCVLAALLLYWLPPWRYRVMTETTESGRITLSAEGAYEFAWRWRPPRVERAWEQGGVHIRQYSEQPEVDTLRLGLSAAAILTFGCWLVHWQGRGRRLTPWRWLVALGLTGGGWFAADRALRVLQPAVEQYFMEREYARRLQLLEDSLRVTRRR